ncbi:hypothetical protein QBC38DRAFT_372007 [Podospora fimiseda]|uniref:Uncharacterized protein n=1 Tax=Podospora fimiseda TaxID=252190 RepID=A0AAN7BIL4_9PEZI|nr:hypothetical protein QBC38DRAFT_372007 [Podospora fimiseda]
MLPEPSITFTVPSLHDGIPIDCRVYHPGSLKASPNSPPWRKHAAIFAHPYGPLGGSYDDGVVDIAASTLLRMGFLVATFNFRGSHGSAGKTSWTSKAERADYMSVVGFLAHYVHFLDPFRRITLRRTESAPREDEFEIDGESPAKIQIHPPTPNPGEELPVMLLGGYSYGSMVTTQLPYLQTILAAFEAPTCGSPAAEIRLRAEHLADMQNTLLASARAAAVDRQAPPSPRKSLNLRVGGDESNRKSHESHRPFSIDLEDKIRHGIEELMARTKKGQKPASRGNGAVVDHLHPVPNLTVYRPAYLLVSPLQGVVRNLTTMSLPTPLSNIAKKLWNQLPARNKSPSQAENIQPPQPLSVEAEAKLVQNPTLAIYGDRDNFVSARKLRQWTSRLEGIPDSQFRAHEVSTATHFWQGKLGHTLRDAIQAYAQFLLQNTDIIK